MMLPQHTAHAGIRGPTVRSDCWVEVELSPAGERRHQITSRVAALYGDAIQAEVRAALAALAADDLRVTLDDAGALPWALLARVETAVRRLRPATINSALPPLNPATCYPSERHRLRRSRLYLPGNTPKYFINAGLYRPDAVILDLEDSVPPGEKDAARLLVRNALRAVSFYGAEKMVRINALPGGLEDVRMLASHGVHTLLLPKVETAEEVLAVAELLDELSHDEPRCAEVYLIPIVESARGALQAWSIAAASPRTVALAIGLEDYTANIGARRTLEGRESLWARGQIVNAARAAGVQPLASVWSDLADSDGLHAWSTEARAWGFAGVGCVHPQQVRVVHAAFTPSRDEIERARRIVAASIAAQAAGLGVVSVDDRMVDAPVVERAREALRLASAAGKLSEAQIASLDGAE